MPLGASVAIIAVLQLAVFGEQSVYIPKLLAIREGDTN
jgi:hypothetical protein